MSHLLSIIDTKYFFRGGLKTSFKEVWINLVFFFLGKPTIFILDKIKVDTICNNGTYADYISVIDHVHAIFLLQKEWVWLFVSTIFICKLLYKTKIIMASNICCFSMGSYIRVLDAQLQLLCLWRSINNMPFILIK